MTFDELLQRQAKERGDFEKDRYNDWYKLVDRQKASPEPANFEPIKEQLIEAYKKKEADLIAQHEKEKEDWLEGREKEKDEKKELADQKAIELEKYQEQQKKYLEMRQNKSLTQ